MSVTIETTPPLKAPAYSYTPIFWDVSSDRDTADSGAVLSVVLNGIKASYEVPSLAGIIKVGDIVNLSGFAVETTYNGLQEVNIALGDFFTTNKDFTATDTGTLTRANNGFQIRGDIHVFDAPVVSIASVANLGGGIIRVTTSAAHGYTVGQLVRHRETDDYNGVFEITNIDATTTYDVAATFVATNTGDSILGEIRGVKRQSTVLPAVPTDYRIAVQGILRTRITSDLLALGGSNIVTPNDNSLRFHAMRFTEEFDDLDGLVKEGDNIITVARSFINATRQQDEDQTLSDFELVAPGDRFLTNAPSPQKLAVGEEYQLSFLYDQTADIRVRYETFDNDGNTLGETTLAVVGSIDGRGIFPVNLITTSISRVDVWLFDSAGGMDVSERFRFDREDKCFNTPQRIVWLGRLGGYDAFTFGGRKKIDLKVKKQTFKKNLNVGFATQDAGRTTLSVVPTEAEESFSEFLDKPYLSWLGELYTSPNVFIEIDGNFFAIQVLNNSETIQDEGRVRQARVIWARANDKIVQGN